MMDSLAKGEKVFLPMTIIRTDLVVTKDGKATVELSMPPEIAPGVHHATVIVDEGTEEAFIRKTAELPIRVPAYPAGPVSASFTFGREDIYGDTGRWISSEI